MQAGNTNGGDSTSQDLAAEPVHQATAATSTAPTQVGSRRAFALLLMQQCVYSLLFALQSALLGCDCLAVLHNDVSLAHSLLG